MVIDTDRNFWAEMHRTIRHCKTYQAKNEKEKRIFEG
jgi:hypothetical protein